MRWYHVLPVREAVESATGWPGLLVVFLYSLLTAAVLPLPGEAVLAAPLELGVGRRVELALVVLVGALGKAAGAVVALYLGQSASHSSTATRLLRRLGPRVAAWCRRATTGFLARWEYVGLAALLAVPLFPDTLVIYAFSVLKKEYGRFALAAFVGSLIRLGVLAVVAASSAGAV